MLISVVEDVNVIIKYNFSWTVYIHIHGNPGKQ